MILCAAVDASAQDLTGHWYLRVGSGTFAEIAQTGPAIEISWTEGINSWNFTGTFSGDHVSATDGSVVLELDSSIDGDSLYGYFGSPGTGFYPRSFRRCDCFDENSTDGDGCDATCRIESCYGCSGDPSVCSPLADTTPCDDIDDCTTGETCTAAACGGGAPVPAPCVSLNGLWRKLEEVPDFSLHSVSTAVLQQRNGQVADYGPTRDPGEEFTSVGSINPATGEMSLTYPSTSLFCPSSIDFDGAASLDNLGYSGVGIASTSTPHTCVGFGYTVVAQRCDEVAGCSVTSCAGIDDGLACEDGDSNTQGEVCTDGVCSGGSSWCPLCQVDNGAGSCVNGPRNDCLPTTRSTGSALKFTDRIPDDKDNLRFSWKKGVATDLADFGNPAATSDVGLCVFDEALPAASLVLISLLPRGQSCGEGPCWTGGNGKLSYKNTESGIGGITRVSIRAGAEGRSAIQMQARGVGIEAISPNLPETPLATPLRAQFQVRDGACFEAEFPAGGVKKNEGGVFKASGGTQP